MRNIFRSSDSMRFTLIALIMMVFIKVFIVDGMSAYRSDSSSGGMIEPMQGDIVEKAPSFANLVVDHIEPARIGYAPPPSIDFSISMPQPESIENNAYETETALVIEKKVKKPSLSM